MRRIAIALVLFGCTEPAPAPPDAGADAGPPDWFATDEPLSLAPACPAAAGEAGDVLAAARLTSEGTATTLRAWTRESRDAIGTVRDDVTDNGWLPGPVERGVARVEIDLAPAAGRPISVRAIELEWIGAAPPAQVRARAACGGALVSRVDVSGSRVELDDVCASCLELLVAGDGASRLSALRVLSGDAVPLPELPAPTGAAIAHPSLGVIEGFYGQPWTWSERARVIDSLSRAGLGVYVYAPKHDPLHRSAWRAPYDAAFLEPLGELAAVAEERGVRVMIALSPFVDFDGSTGDDLELLVTKLRALVRAGAHAVALFADDIEIGSGVSVDGALGAVHAAAVNEVLAALRDDDPDVELWFVGTVYSDSRLTGWPDGRAYLEALRALDPSVRVLWTGTDTFSESLAASDLAAVAAAVERPPALWDNFWANDLTDNLYGRALLGAYEGRERDLLGATTGIVQNPMIQGALARLAAGTFVTWATDLEADAAGMRAGSAALETAHTFGASADAASDAAVFVRLLETFDAANERSPVDRALAGALSRLAAALEAGGEPDGADLELALDRAAAARALRSALHHSGAAPDLADELDAPLAKVDAAAEVLLLALDRVAAVRAGEDAGGLTSSLRERRGVLPASSRFRWMDEEVGAFADVALAFEGAAAIARPALGAPVPPCVAGTPLELAPFEGASRLAAHGLTGASVEGARVRWTPPHAGRWLATFVALPQDGAGWRSRTETLVCAPAE